MQRGSCLKLTKQRKASSRFVRVAVLQVNDLALADRAACAKGGRSEPQK
jgi:hypothetical protein